MANSVVNDTATVPIVWRDHALHPDLRRAGLPAGLTVAEIVERVPNLPVWFRQHGEVTYGGVIVPREAWHRVRPKYDPCGRNIMHLYLPLQGGSTGGVLRTVATIAIVVAAMWATGGGAGAFFAAGSAGAAFFGAGGIGAIALGTGIAPGGALARGVLS